MTRVRDGVMDGVGGPDADEAGVSDDVGDLDADGVSDAVLDELAPLLSDAEGVRVLVRVNVMDGVLVALTDGLAVALRVTDGVAVKDTLAVDPFDRVLVALVDLL